MGACQHSGHDLPSGSGQAAILPDAGVGALSLEACACRWDKGRSAQRRRGMARSPPGGRRLAEGGRVDRACSTESTSTSSLGRRRSGRVAIAVDGSVPPPPQAITAATERLPVEADIAYWLDRVKTATGAPLDSAVMRTVDAVTVMSYRDKVSGPDGIAGVGANALRTARARKHPVAWQLKPCTTAEAQLRKSRPSIRTVVARCSECSLAWIDLSGPTLPTRASPFTTTTHGAAWGAELPRPRVRALRGRLLYDGELRRVGQPGSHLRFGCEAPSTSRRRRPAGSSPNC